MEDYKETKSICFNTSDRQICLVSMPLEETDDSSPLVTQGPIGRSIGGAIGSIFGGDQGRDVGGEVGSATGDLFYILARMYT